MVSGITQRFKGKINFGVNSLYVHGRALFGKVAIQTPSLVSSSLGASTFSGSFIVPFSSLSTTQSIARLTPPLFAGDNRMIQMSTLNGLGLILTASTDGSITINGSSITTLKSTGSTVQTIELVATSTTNWAVVGAIPFFGSSLTLLWTGSTSS